MSDRKAIAVWLKEVAKRANFSSIRGSNGSTAGVMVAVSMNTFDKLEEWAHENIAARETPTFYGVPFTYDQTLEDDEVRIKEKP